MDENKLIKTTDFPNTNEKTPNKFYVVFEATEDAFNVPKEQFMEAMELELELGTKDMLHYMSEQYDRKNKK